MAIPGGAPRASTLRSTDRMRFRLFGIPIEIQLGFWFIAVLLGWGSLSGSRQYLIVEWVAVVLVSIIVHELGHALAMLRYGLRPEITLYTMGGLTAGEGMQRLGRAQRIFISFAGPLAGFILGGAVIALTYAVPALRQVPAVDAGPAEWTLFSAMSDLVWVNIGWGVINLIPVLPLDGGHILEDSLGPRRARLTATISVGAGGLVTLLALSQGQLWIAFVFGLCTFQSYQRFRMAAEAEAPRRVSKPVEPEEPIAPELAQMIAKARAALADDRYDEAGTLAELIIADKPPKRARLDALTVLAWAHLLKGRAEEAGRVVKAIARDREPDPALVGAVLFQQNQHEEARKVFEAARAAGDDRKEIVGPLIQILIAQGEVARAAAIALDIVESLSDEDVRQMAAIALEHEAYGWSARLYEALFDRTSDPDDAYAAARSKSLEGDVPAALGLLRRAVAAGFDDRKRAWSDAALEQLRDGESSGELEALLPRP